jgi:uncharacterized protein (TIGR02996 family)
MTRHPAFPDPAARLPGEADLLAGVVANPADDTARLVYADWLQERGDPRGSLLRASVAAFRAGKKLPSAKAVPKPWCDLVGITLLGKLRTAGLSDRAGSLLPLARPALRFKSAKAAEATLPVGAGRLGGRPDLPPETKWPTYQEEPLAFLGQFNLADLAASLVCRELPADGVLSVFYLPDEEDDRGSDPKGTFRVFHFPDVSKLARRDPPAELGEGRRFRSCRVTFAETLTMPDVESPWRKELGLGGDEDARDKYQEQVAGFDCGHRLLGHPTPIQNDVLGRKSARHLLTIGTDDRAGWEWFDGGSLYFTIGEGDLRAGRFDRVRCELQCG